MCMCFLVAEIMDADNNGLDMCRSCISMARL